MKNACTSVRRILCLLMISGSFSASAHISSSDEIIVISEGTILYQETGKGNPGTIDTAVSQGKIFISAGTVLYNSEAILNAKIIKAYDTAKTEKIRRVTETKQEKQSSSKKEVTQRQTSVSEYKNQLPADTFFSKSIQKQTAFLQNRTQPDFNEAANTTLSADKSFIYLKNKRTFSKNPFVPAIYLSGKYSIRPPTLLQM